jgi:hypothetical protein
MRIRRRVLALWIVSLATSVAFAQSSAVPTKAPDSSLPVEIVVPVAPIAVRGAGASHLFYELHLTNFRATPLEMTNLEVHAGDHDGRLLEGYSGQEISDRLVRAGRAARSTGQAGAHDDRSRNSDAPHLHFHITDGASAFASEGVPYVFETMQFRGNVASLEKLIGDEPWIPQSGTVVRRNEIPLDTAVVRFP